MTACVALKSHSQSSRERRLRYLPTFMSKDPRPEAFVAPRADISLFDGAYGVGRLFVLEMDCESGCSPAGWPCLVCGEWRARTQPAKPCRPRCVHVEPMIAMSPRRRWGEHAPDGTHPRSGFRIHPALAATAALVLGKIKGKLGRVHLMKYFSRWSSSSPGLLNQCF